MKKKYTIYSDGSSKGNGLPTARGGWGSIIVDPEGNEKEISGCLKGATNNQMELAGVIEAFKHIPPDNFVEVVSDSDYVIRGAGEWLRGWVKGGFKNIKNVDLWKELILVTTTQRILWTWVKGHAGHPYNERCDILAGKAANTLI